MMRLVSIGAYRIQRCATAEDDKGNELLKPRDEGNDLAENFGTAIYETLSPPEGGKQNDPIRVAVDNITCYIYSRTLRRRSELEITDTELKLIAAAARIGLSRIPKNG
jgi:hypothetical protein